MRIVFIELYYELRFFYYFLSFIGFEVHYFKILFLRKIADNTFYLNQVESLKKRKIFLINIIDEEKDGFNFENFDNDFTGATLELNNNLLKNNIIDILSKHFNANISKKKFEIYMRAILQANIQRQFQQIGGKINYWFNNNKSRKKNFLIFSNFANFFVKLDNQNIMKIYFPINLIFFPINLIIKIFSKILRLFYKSKGKISKLEKIKNKVNIHFNSKYLYVLHKSVMFGKHFEKKLFYYENDKNLSEKEMISVVYHNNNEDLFNLLEASNKIKIKYLLNSSLLFLRIIFSKISLKNIALGLTCPHGLTEAHDVVIPNMEANPWLIYKAEIAFMELIHARIKVYKANKENFCVSIETRPFGWGIGTERTLLKAKLMAFASYVENTLTTKESV